MNKHSITVLISAFNEEQTIAEAILKTDEALRKHVIDYEIIVFDDGSRDATGKIAEDLAKNNNRLRVVRNKTNKNLGYNLRMGVSLAGKEYCMAFVNADSYPLEESFRQFFSVYGEKDFVLGYSVNYGDRPWLRRFLSWLFVKIMNFLFGFRIKYYNGPVIIKTALWRTVPMTIESFAYMAEVTATLLKRGIKYDEAQIFYMPERKGLNISVLRRNIWGVAKAIALMFWRLNIKRQLYVKPK
ncbi:MAG: glycosyltransferase family 2 protein [Candidatus Harrisonbacteria bacterium]|nr:glycosyltransferase family 2 protein [Candidatus Harrisonbacteria bacterium]